jgi:hypothetical protein
VLVNNADQRNQDRRGEHEEAPEDERVHQPGSEPLEQFALSENDLGLVASTARHIPGALGRRRSLYESDEEADAGREQRSAHGNGSGQR